MALVSFLNLIDGSTLDVESTYVETLAAVPPALLPAGVPAGTRIGLLARLAPTSYADVVGTVAATIAALGGAPPAPFGSSFATSSAGPSSTSSAAFVAVPGTALSITQPGTYIVFPTGVLSVNNIAEGAGAVILKNGAPIGQPIFINPGGFVAPGQAQYEFCQHIVDAPIAGDTYEIGILAIPGGGPNLATIDGARLSLWQV